MSTHATLIADAGGLVLGVVVNLSRLIAEGKSGSCLEAHASYAVRQALCAELSDDGEQWGYAGEWRDRMRVEVGAFRWVPRNDGSGVRPHIEPAEPGSRGSWIGAYWSEV